MDLHALTVTVHGRTLLAEICLDSDNGLAPEIRRIFWVLVQTAPVGEWSTMN